MKPRQSSQPDKEFGFGGDSEISPFRADRYWIGVVFMVKKKKIFFVFIKRKDTNTRMN